ncbi:bacteriocin immunity protein [Spongiimicrobium sp. 3-5]|uniref:bacteriocin immunity protein n=1 Tax=Spongiimicrobium sp. 3-5 TaxID=3332596 RepID=UPI0039808744
MTRDELVVLGNKIVNCEGTEVEINEMIDKFNKNVPHPNGANLFFYPENFNARTDDLKSYNPSVEDVVDLALNYNPVVLPPPSKR